MLFVTREFLLGFLPIVLGAFYLALALGLRRLLIPILLIASIVFYAWGNPAQTPILAVSILVRGLRFGSEALLLKIYGEPIRTFVEKRLALVASAGALAVVGLIMALKFAH